MRLRSESAQCHAQLLAKLALSLFYVYSVDLRILVMLLLDTLPMLGNVLLICFFVFFIFGILGVQLWSGMLRQRCFMPDNMTHLIQNTSNMYNM